MLCDVRQNNLIFCAKNCLSHSRRSMKTTNLKILFAFLCLAGLGFPATTAGQTNYTPYAVTTLNSLGDAPNGTTYFVDRPYDVAIYGNSNIYVVSYQQYTVWKMWTTNGTNWSQALFAGATGAHGSADGVGTGARFLYPVSLVTDSHGNIFVGDAGNYTIRKITPEGVVTTFAGKRGQSLHIDGVGTNAAFKSIGGLGIDTNDNIYMSDYSANRLRKITAGAVVTTIAANSTPYAEWGGSVCVGPDGNIYHASSSLMMIRKVTPGGVVTPIAGVLSNTNSADGTNFSARFNVPNDIVADAFGNLYVTDAGGATIRKMTQIGNDWVTTTIAGVPLQRANNDGTGSAARFTFPAGITIDSSGKLYISDNNSGLNTGARIRWAVPNGANRWTNANNGKWEEATTKWSAGAPSLNNTANYITNAGTKVVLIDPNTVTSNLASLTINKLFLSAPTGSTNFLILFDTEIANPLHIHESLVVGDGGVMGLTNAALTAGYVAVGLTNGNAFLNIVNGSVFTDNFGFVGYLTAKVSGVLLTGQGSIWNNQKTLTIGYFSQTTNAVFVQEGTTLNVGETAAIGEVCDGNALAVSGPGATLNIGGNFRVGYYGDRNRVGVYSNAVAHVGSLDIGEEGDENGIRVGEGSTLTSSGPIRLVNGTGPEGNDLSIAAGGTVVTPSLVASNGGLVIVSGRLETGGTTVDNGYPFYVGLATTPAVLKLNGGTHSFALGLGITTGASLIGCGNIESYLTIIDTGATVNLDSGCQLNFNGDVTNRGTLNADSTLSVTTNYTQTSEGTLHVDLGGTNAGVFGKLNVGNAAVLGGSLVVTIGSSFTPTTNDTFTIVNAVSRTGTFANFIYPSNLVGMTISYTPTSAIIQVTHAPISITNAPGINNGEFATDFTGQPGTTYLIEYTDSLYPANWLTLTNVVASPSGNVSLRDVPLQPSRYYRARYITE